MLYSINIIPFLDNNNEYIKILTISPPPNDSLINITKRVNLQKLSPFKNYNSCENKCVSAFIKNKNSDEFLCPNNIDILYTNLLDNGYKIDNDFTKYTLKANLNNNQQLLFYVYK